MHKGYRIGWTVAHVYPLMLDVTTRPVVIVGGGTVAARKASGLIQAGATKVKVVALSFSDEMPGEVQRVVASYDSSQLTGADIVFAATDVPEINDQVVLDARRSGAWVSRADADHLNPGDFVMPARFTEGQVTVAVSAGSAALAMAIRDALRMAFDLKWALIADAMTKLRPAVIATPGLTTAQRREIFHHLASEEARQIVSDGGLPALLDWARRRHPELAAMKIET